MKQFFFLFFSILGEKNNLNWIYLHKILLGCTLFFILGCQYIWKKLFLYKKIVDRLYSYLLIFKVTHLLWNLKCTLMVRLNSIEELLTLKSSKNHLITKDNSCHRHFLYSKQYIFKKKYLLFWLLSGFLGECF